MLSVVFSCSSNLTSLNRVCPKDCPDAGSSVGICRPGTPVCDDEMNVIDCVGVVLPQEEVCNGLDDDCNGLVDELSLPINTLLFNIKYPDELNPCYVYGVCGTSMVICNSEWTCDYSTFYEKDETRCDGFDNDCDGQTDENLFEDCTDLLTGNLGKCSCYSGPSGTEQGVCRSGWVECVSGNPICIGDITPTIEVCDLKDRDCDGIIDNVPGLVPHYIVIFLDGSGSMCSYIAAVAGACTEYGDQFDGNPNFKFALVTMTNSGPQDELVKVLVDFSDFSVVREAILRFSCSGAGYEASLDGLYLICETANQLNLSWSTSSNVEEHIFMFTDEWPQSYLTPLVSQQMVIDTCVANEIDVNAWYKSTYFDSITSATGGLGFPLSASWEGIFADMNTVISNYCEVSP